MGADLPDEADVPPDGHADRRDDQSGGGRAGRAGGAEAEPRNRQEYYADLRVAVSAEESVTARRTAAGEQAAAEKWDKSAEESRWMWAEYQRKWPPAEREPADRPDDPPGSWRGDGDRSLNRADNSRVEAECDRVAERERDKISPALRATERQDPDRHLIGLEHRLKGSDLSKRRSTTRWRSLTSRQRKPSRLCRTGSGTPSSTVRLATLRAFGRMWNV